MRQHLKKNILIITLAWVLLIPALCSGGIPNNRVSGDLLSLDLNVYVAARPIHLILVEKDYQRLRVLRHDGRLKVIAEYFAATGENYGPKKNEGDEKTPEGIYFITKTYTDKKITIFGNRAFHLNYPNIFDSKSGLDGNGIYIHGTNKELRSNSTNGCVTLNNTDLDALVQYLNVDRTPVIIVSSLQNLNTGKGVYPNLPGQDYRLAKELLAPKNVTNISFTNLYLIRVGAQTVVAGSFKQNNRTRLQTFAASYLDVSQEKGWFIADHIPTLDPDKISSKQIAENALENESSMKNSPPNLTGLLTPLQLGLADDYRIWQPDNKEDFVSWYQDSIQDSMQMTFSTNPHEIQPEKENKAAQPKPLQQKDSVLLADKPFFLSGNAAPITNPLIYGAIILAACLGGSALFYLRSQKQMSAQKNPPTIAELQNENALRQSVHGIIRKVQLLQNDMQREAYSMDNQGLRARIVELETSLSNKLNEIEKLMTEKAALKLKGMGGMAGQVEELGIMQQALKMSEKKLAKAQENLLELPVLQEAVSEKQSHIQQLLVEKATLKLQASGMLDQENSSDSADEQYAAQITALQDALQSEEERRKQIEEEASTLRNQIESLDKSQEEIALLQTENAALHEKEVDTTTQQNLKQEVTILRIQLADLEATLRAEQQNKSGSANQNTPLPTDQQARINDLEALLGSRQNELNSLHAQIQSHQEDASTEQKRISTTLQEQIDLLTQRLDNETSLRQQAEQDAQDQQDAASALHDELAELKSALAHHEALSREEASTDLDPHPPEPAIVPDPQPLEATIMPDSENEMHATQTELEQEDPVEIDSPPICDEEKTEPLAQEVEEMPATTQPQPESLPVQKANQKPDFATSAGTDLLPNDIMQQWINS